MLKIINELPTKQMLEFMLNTLSSFCALPTSTYKSVKGVQPLHGLPW
jgi:hypothetical protein